jgi:hypothetical protein
MPSDRYLHSAVGQARRQIPPGPVTTLMRYFVSAPLNGVVSLQGFPATPETRRRPIQPARNHAPQTANMLFEICASLREACLAWQTLACNIALGSPLCGGEKRRDFSQPACTLSCTRTVRVSYLQHHIPPTGLYPHHHSPKPHRSKTRRKKPLQRTVWHVRCRISVRRGLAGARTQRPGELW